MSFVTEERGGDSIAGLYRLLRLDYNSEEANLLGNRETKSRTRSTFRVFPQVKKWAAALDWTIREDRIDRLSGGLDGNYSEGNNYSCNSYRCARRNEQLLGTKRRFGRKAIERGTNLFATEPERETFERNDVDAGWGLGELFGDEGIREGSAERIVERFGSEWREEAVAEFGEAGNGVARGQIETDAGDRPGPESAGRISLGAERGGNFVCGPNSLSWYDLKSEQAKVLLSGKTAIADVKISPDGKWVSFVREHNLHAISTSDGKEHALTTGGTEEMRKGELDWVYPEELAISTAYWWAPDGSAVAFLEMDERKVTKYPMVDFESYTGEAEEERYPVGGGK